jgi:type VI secretion system protein ImpM
VQGFFGKIPSHGDFVRRNLPHAFVDPWDEWLQQAVAASKTELGEAWLNTYLTSPVWRFVLQPGVCGDEGWAGILMPSVDRVGRYFPLTVAASLGEAAQPFQLASRARTWFEAAENVALQVLEQDHVDADALGESISGIDDSSLKSESDDLPALAGGAWGLRITGGDGPGLAPAVSHELVRFQVGVYSLWWNDGSDDLSSMALVAPSLPDPACFARLLEGSWGALEDVEPEGVEAEVVEAEIVEAEGGDVDAVVPEHD